MIHHEILEEIKQRRQHGSFIYPDYGCYSIAEVPPTILSFFNIPTERAKLEFDAIKNPAQKYRNLLFFFIDGLAYDHFIEYEKELPFFKRLHNTSDIFPLTSVFPSTTSAALTTLQTGLTPQEHGLPEWTVYLEELDKISFGTLLEKEGSPDILYKGRTLYQVLKDHGVGSYVFTYESYLPSAYSEVTQGGAKIVCFKDLDDLIPKIIETMRNASEPSYFFVYWGDVDSIEHKFGPRSKEHVYELHRIGLALEELSQKIDKNIAEKTLMIVSSDHGQINIRNEDIIYLNKYLNLEASYFLSPSKKLVVPTGAPHDVFLHIHEPKINEVLEFLRKELRGKADVITTAEALEKGLFGLYKPIERFMKRIGHILILPYEGYHVWYQHFPNFFWKQLGIHGGLSRQEMLVPFIVTDLTAW